MYMSVSRRVRVYDEEEQRSKSKARLNKRDIVNIIFLQSPKVVSACLVGDTFVFPIVLANREMASPVMTGLL